MPGVPPSTCLTWFQAEQASRLSGKRLLPNEEWQAAAAGTRDPGLDDGSTTCVTNPAFAAPTGSRSACVSSRRGHDMVGNVWEWVAGWLNPATGCTRWDDAHRGEISCRGFSSTTITTLPMSSVSVQPREVVWFELARGNHPGRNFATGTTGSF